MNIYQHVENVVRELDSKLLLATLAAARGHQVIVSDLESIEKGIKKKVLAPGIFHTKSLTPSDPKIARHQAIIDNGILITSIDEEGGLIMNTYDGHARRRYSELTIEQSSAIFGWGPHDVEFLKQFYSKHSAKIHKTGSPRADLWKSVFSDYWGVPKRVPKKPFLLVASNMSYANYNKPFHDIIKSNRKSGYYDRDPKMFLNNFGRAAEDYRKTAAFIEAVEHLGEHNNGYDIVFRPHQNENIDSWKVYLEGIPNVHVIREGSITAWVNNAFAIMHNSCTTALEATVSQKPLVTYIPFEQEHGYELPNGLGYRVTSKDELLNKVNGLFDNIKSSDQNNLDTPIPEQVSKKIYIDNSELAAEKIIKVWERLASDNKVSSKSSNFMLFKCLLKFMKFNGMIGRVLKRLSTNKFRAEKTNFKFPTLDRHDICERVNKLKSVLGIDEKIECKLLSERTILIKRYR